MALIEHKALLRPCDAEHARLCSRARSGVAAMLAHARVAWPRALMMRVVRRLCLLAARVDGHVALRRRISTAWVDHGDVCGHCTLRAVAPSLFRRAFARHSQHSLGSLAASTWRRCEATAMRPSARMLIAGTSRGRMGFSWDILDLPLVRACHQLWANGSGQFGEACQHACRELIRVPSCLVRLLWPFACGRSN